METQKPDFILLAAGKSSRMHQDKALLPFQGKPWIQIQVEEILKSGVIDKIIIVDQPTKTKQYLEVLKAFGTKLQVLENRNPDSQPSDSILIAVQNSEFPQGAFISPIDVPQSSSLLQFLYECPESTMEILKPSFEGRGGHPVWLHPKAIEKFRNKPKRLDEFIAEFPSEKVHFLKVQSSMIHMNLNTPEEWQKFLNQAT